MWITADKKTTFICFLIAFLGGLWGFDLNIDSPIIDKFELLPPKNINYATVFIYIFSRNLTVGLMLSFLGFITGGSLTILILLYNGIAFGMFLKSIFNNYLCPYDMILKHIIPHAFTEILGFCLFGAIGLKGFNFYKCILMESSLNLILIPKLKEAFLPTFLLFFSAIIETVIST
jgi:uncharacterized membrane protein SpoIIM required for sporulation